MELDDFITATLQQVARGIGRANLDYMASFPAGEERSIWMMPGGKAVAFDVAITAGSNASKDGGAKISVLGWASLGGKGKKEDRTERVSRIRFEITMHQLDSFVDYAKPR